MLRLQEILAPTDISAYRPFTSANATGSGLGWKTPASSCSRAKAAIPLSAFYGNGFDQRVVRFCFARKDEMLHLALERMAKL
jgi:hypothetical protein